MIKVDVFDRTPMFPGDIRELVLSGDGPFQVTNSCFVDAPPPAGFRPCSACNSVIVQARTPHYIVAEQSFWTGKEGEMEIAIVDAVGDQLSLRLNVTPDNRNRNQPIFARA